MSGRHSVNKGKRFEREIAKLLRPIFPEARRGLTQARSAAEDADITGIPGYHIECKVGKRPNPLAAIRQAEASANGNIPVAICKTDRQTPTVTLYLPDFLKLLRAATDHYDDDPIETDMDVELDQDFTTDLTAHDFELQSIDLDD